MHEASKVFNAIRLCDSYMHEWIDVSQLGPIKIVNMKQWMLIAWCIMPCGKAIKILAIIQSFC